MSRALAPELPSAPVAVDDSLPVLQYDLTLDLFYDPCDHRLRYRARDARPQGGVSADLDGNLTVVFGFGTADVIAPRHVAFVPRKPPGLAMAGIIIDCRDRDLEPHVARTGGPIPGTPFSVEIHPDHLVLEDRKDSGALGDWQYTLLLTLDGKEIEGDPEIHNLGTSDPK